MKQYAFHLKNPAGEIIEQMPIYNTFRADAQQTFFQKNRVYWIFLATAAITLGSYLVDWGFIDDYQNKKFDEMAITVVDFGDFVSLSKARASRNYVEIDEVFGNQYIKEKDKVVDNTDPDWVDPRIAAAVNPVIGNATAPVDLNPELEPQYTSAARAAGIEGTVFLELVIGDEGKVLRARPVGRQLGHGLEEAAIRCYERKRFKPSKNQDGGRITVKIIQPVRYVLY
jgi:TonB family protein